MKNLPIGRQDFKSLIEDDCLYIDKTEDIFRLVTELRYVFLSRPRRFGKSLSVSTMKYLFEGEKALFKDLWIEDKWNWDEKSPVISLSFNSILKKDYPLTEAIHRTLDKLIEQWELSIEEISVGNKFDELIRQLSAKHGKVVILIDEYDKPIINFLGIDHEQAEENREILKDFCTPIKDNDANIRFFFITGVTQFSRVSIFSELNNLHDITTSRRFTSLVGYTQEELKANFSDRIQALAEEEEMTIPDTHAMIKEWYNGFRFSAASEKVYNPFSILGLLQEKSFKLYWFSTGTPSFLINLIKEKEFNLYDFHSVELDESGLEKFEIKDITLEPLLYQTGYLTISDYDKSTGTYSLDFPNLEVSEAFHKHLFTIYRKNFLHASSDLLKLEKALKANDIERFMEVLEGFFLDVDYDLHIRAEKYYQSMFYLIFRLLGMRIKAEMHTNKGRIDAVIELENNVYLFEFKMRGTAQKALQQIEERGYSDKFLQQKKTVHEIGAVFSFKEKNLSDWAMRIKKYTIK